MQWLTRLFSRRRIYSDLSEEIRQHMEEKIAALVASGMTLEEARYAARREFGNATRIEESGREVWGWPAMEGILSDLKFAIRKLRQSPGFALTAIMTLALGIGANVVIFGLVNGLLLRPLDVPDPGNLFEVVHGRGGFASQSYRDYLDYRDRNSSFSGMLAYEYMGAGFSVGKGAVRSWGYAASGNYFDVLGVKPSLGRFFSLADVHGPGSAPLIVLSHGFWQSQFDSNPQVLGETVLLNHHPFTVVGVAGENFHGTDSFFVADYWIPLLDVSEVTGFDDLCCRDHYPFTVLGRLKPGVTPVAAAESLNALCAHMASEDPKDEGLSAVLRLAGPAGDAQSAARTALTGITLLAALVLLAACANLASIFAARTADRGGELAVRIAIGSSRWRVLRQLLAEALVVAVLGGLVGSFAARLLLEALSNWQAFPNMPTHFFVAPDTRVYLVAFGLSVASGLLFGLLPARQVWRTEVMQTIRSGYLRSESFRRFAARDLLLMVQIVVCTLLVTASLVAVRGMILSLHVPLAFQPDGAVLGETDLRMAGESGEQALAVQKRMLEAAEAIPGVTAAAVSDTVPFRGGADWFVYRWGTTKFIPAHKMFAAPTFLVSPGYFHAAQTHLIAGREFTWHDDGRSPRVAIINQTFARRLYGDRSPIGQRFALWETAKYQVVGLVEDGKYLSISEDPQPAMFLPLAQGVGGTPQAAGGILSTQTTVLVRSALPGNQIAAPLLKVMSSLEPDVPVNAQPWGNVVDRSLMPARVATVMLGVMGVIAAMLAVTGVFGMASYSVSRRRKEQGIRIALGAGRVQVMRSVLRRPLLLLISGSAIGIAAGLLATRVLAHLVAFATPHDPLVLAGVVLAMTLLGLAGAWGPARRALSIDAARLLRE
jgi:predicted permease